MQTTTIERWKAIPGFEKYEASDMGRVRKASNGRLLKQRKCPKGYLMVSLLMDRTKHMRVHRLVLMAFVGPCPEGMECCHGNHIRDDNRLTNLRWDTHLNNVRESSAAMPSQRGADHNRAKLTEEQALRVIRAGEHVKDLAREFGVSRSRLCNIRAGRGWMHLPRS